MVVSDVNYEILKARLEIRRRGLYPLTQYIASRHSRVFIA